MMDDVSVALSTGRGKAFSIRSSEIGSMNSVMTPDTNVSVSSSAFKS